MPISIPKDSNGNLIIGEASLENKQGDCEIRKVPVKELDEFGFTDTDLIKIDVESHEAQVIEGAKKTLEASKQVIVVEIEQRHIGQTPIDQ